MAENDTKINITNSTSTIRHSNAHHSSISQANNSGSGVRYSADSFGQDSLGTISHFLSTLPSFIINSIRCRRRNNLQQPKSAPLCIFIINEVSKIAIETVRPWDTLQNFPRVTWYQLAPLGHVTSAACDGQTAGFSDRAEKHDCTACRCWDGSVPAWRRTRRNLGLPRHSNNRQWQHYSDRQQNTLCNPVCLSVCLSVWVCVSV